MLTKQGDNWKLIKDLEKGKYCYLISINNWAIELEDNEFDSLYPVSYTHLRAHET